MAGAERAAVDGVVLAGGRATRLPGKPLIEISGWPLVSRPVGALREAGLRPTVVGKQDDRELEAVVSDLGAGWLGEVAEEVHPLLGVVTALTALGRPVLVVAADMPYLEPALLRAIAEDQRGAGGVVACEAGGRLQPLLARYDPRVLEEMASAAARGESAIMALKALGGRLVVVSEDEVARFGDPGLIVSDVDTPADLRSVEDRL